MIPGRGDARLTGKVILVSRNFTSGQSGALL